MKRCLAVKRIEVSVNVMEYMVDGDHPIFKKMKTIVKQYRLENASE